MAMSSRPPDASPSADAAAANEAGHRQQAKEVLRLSSTMQPVLLSDPLDEDNLTDTLCFVRRQTQFFAAHSDDVEARFSKGGKKAEIRVGQIGIRCAHCARLPPGDRVNGAASFPASISLVYQAVRNWQSKWM